MDCLFFFKAEGYRNETGVGKGLRASGLAREAYFVTTKLFPGNPAWGMPLKDYDATIAACEASRDEQGWRMDHRPHESPHRQCPASDRTADRSIY